MSQLLVEEAAAGSEPRGEQLGTCSDRYGLTAVAKAPDYNRWIVAHLRPYLGQRVLEVGAGIGNISQLLLNCQRLILVDHEEMHVSILRDRFGGDNRVRVDWGDLTEPGTYEPWKEERIDTIVCSNVLEHLWPDQEVLQRLYHTLVPGGHCILVVPAGQWLYTGMDREFGHCRRYARRELATKLAAAGFGVIFAKQFNRLGALAWAVSGHVLRRRQLSSRQMVWFDRLLPVVRILESVLPVPGMSLIMVGRKPGAVGRSHDGDEALP